MGSVLKSVLHVKKGDILRIHMYVRNLLQDLKRACKLNTYSSICLYGRGTID